MTGVVTEAYCDGGVIGANPSKVGGTWAFVLVGVDAEYVRSESGVLYPEDVFTERVGNNQSEYYAFGRMLAALPDAWSGPVYSDSQNTIGRIFHGWKCDGIPARWRVFIETHRCRLGVLTPILLDGHPTKKELAAGVGKRGNPVSPHNQHCDRECGRRAEEVLGKQGRDAA